MKKKNDLHFHLVFTRTKLHSLMRFSTILLLGIAMQVSAKGLSQKITINKNRTPVKKVLNLIQEQSGYSLLYDDALINNAPRVTVKVSNASIEEALKAGLKGLALTYTIKDRIITIKKESRFTAGKTAARVSGIVKTEDGGTLQGATVLIKELNKAAETNPDGSFSIMNVPPGNYTLAVTYVGYDVYQQSITVGDAPLSLTILLKQSQNTEENVVVTALGIKKEARATGYNVQTISSSEINTNKDPSFVNNLTGKIAGATINASAGGVGGSVRVVLRGTKSITQNNNALYVVDGIPMPSLFSGQPGDNFGASDGGEGISSLNPDDIESISVLSGASSVALYGNQAANGVIQIVTKKGSKAGKLSVNVSSNTGFLSPFVLPELQNTYGPNPSTVTSQGLQPSMFSYGNKLNTPSSYKARDFFQTGSVFSNNISVSSGNEKNQTFFSVGSTNAKGIIPSNTYSRYNFTLRNTTNLTSNLTLDVSAMYLFENRKNVPPSGQYHNPLVGVYLFPPGDVDSANYSLRNFEVFDPSRNFMVQNWPFGQLGLAAENPYWILNREERSSKRERFMGTVALKYALSQHLNVTGRVKYDKSNDVGTAKYYASTISLFSGPNGNFTQSNNNIKQTYADAILNYTNDFGDFGLNVNVGGSYVDTRNNGVNFGGPLAKIPNFFSSTNFATADPNFAVGGSISLPSIQQNQAVFATAQLAFRNYLFLEVTGRNDWNSALAYTTASSLFYPSVNLSGILSDMVKLPEFFSFAKFRASYAEVGNPPSAYLANPKYTISNGTISTITAIPAVTLRPERTKSFEGGIDLKLVKNRINLSLTYYNTNTENQVFTVTLPPSSGFSGYYINAGKINNKGIEATLGANLKAGALAWSPNIVFSLNRNKVKQLLLNYKDPITGTIQNKDSLPVANGKIAVNGGTGDLYAYGLARDANGNILVDDNGIPKISPNQIKVGNSDPRYNLGFNNNFSYKNFSLHFLISARLGGNVISATQALLDYYGVSQASAQARDAGGVWVNGKQIPADKYYAAVANLTGGGGSGNALQLYTYSATNIRLRELSLGYTIPAKVFNDKIKALTVSFVGQNIWMIYNKAPYDPESAASTSTFFQGYDFFNQPSFRNLGFRISASF